jgi:hypothetical protein
MRLFLRILLPGLPVFLSQLICSIQAIINNNNPDHNDISIIINDMCNTYRKVLPALNYSKNTTPHNTFYSQQE